jgi:glucose/arabinose dehydrogenase
MRSRSIAPLAAAVLLASVTLAGCSSDDGVGEVPVTPTRTASDGVSPTSGATASPAPRSAEVPALDVEVVAKGFEHGWDIGFLPDGRALVTERPGRISIVSGLREGATRTTVEADLDDLFVSVEGGLMGMVVHPDFATSRLFTTCQTHQENGQPKDVRLVTWKLSADGTSAQKWRDLLTGLPISTGRHSGCRPTIAPGAVNDSGEDELFVGTGDVAQADVPQSRTSLGGKVLRLDLETGFPLSGNPFFSSGERARAVHLQLRSPQHPGGGGAAGHRCDLHG